jgi:hypothetical protein
MKPKKFLKKWIACLLDADSCYPISFRYDRLDIRPPLQKTRSIRAEKQ